MLDPRDARFACSLFDALRRSEGNLFLSSASIRTALALVYAGARGQTADEMRAALGFDGQAETCAAFTRLLHGLATRAVVLRLVNRVWCAAGRAFLDEFTRVASVAFGAPVERLDFVREAERSRRHINAWVEQATEHKIVDLLAPGQVDPDTKLVVTNAAYFKGQWMQTFEPSATRPAPFFAPGGEVVAQMMRNVTHYAYAELSDVQLAELAYESGEVAMRIALPRSAGGLAAIEARSYELLIAPLGVAKLDLYLPRFRIESRFDVAEALVTLGIRTLFRYPGADLSGIDGTDELYVSCVVHQTFVQTDEQGTEAAAATALVALAGGIPRPEPIVEMRVDRPFLFWILHAPTGTVLFSGRVVDPS